MIEIKLINLNIITPFLMQGEWKKHTTWKRTKANDG